jgi:hypothetical protein
MRINDTLIDDTFAEAFPMKATRLVVGAPCGQFAHRLRDVRHRLRLRGGHRTRSDRR